MSDPSGLHPLTDLGSGNVRLFFGSSSLAFIYFTTLAHSILGCYSLDSGAIGYGQSLLELVNWGRS